jgi:hypothetical protein
MSDVLQQMLEGPSLESGAFPENSRYNGIAIAHRDAGDGTTIAYLRRRFLPRPDQFVATHEHRVTEGERLDLISARELGDPEIFWRICDANGAMRPRELTETIGSRLRITLPAGVPRGPNV